MRRTMQALELSSGVCVEYVTLVPLDFLVAVAVVFYVASKERQGTDNR